MRTLELRDGVAHLNGKPVFLLSADYPYYRDDPNLWRTKLAGFKGLGVKAITAYIPWRHHEVEIDHERRYDFAGETRPNRNVIGFIQVCDELGLPLIAKPGPFCHAELNYGGLPDFVCPLLRTYIEPRLDADGGPAMWNGAALDGNGSAAKWPLPSPFSQTFQNDVSQWLEAVRRDVLLPACAPEGPVIAIQVGNEGIYSDAQHAVWAHDYSAPALTAFRRWLRERYKSLAGYNAMHGTTLLEWEDVEPPRKWIPPTTLRSLESFREWSEFLGLAMGDLLAGYSRQLGLPIPALTNVNPPRVEPWGLDSWFSRVQPRAWKSSLHFGFTNWIGVAAEDASVVDRYAIANSWGRGPNLEENWGFTDYYGQAYAFAVTSFHQSLAMVATGATGFNLYTGASTAEWDEALDLVQARPYPSSAPIDESGTPTPKAGVAALLARFLDDFGAELLECRGSPSIAWGVIPADSFLGAWLAVDEAPVVEGHVLAAPGPILRSVLAHVTDLGHELGLVDLSESDEVGLSTCRVLVIAGQPVMAANIQERLSHYVSAGGHVVVIGEAPHFDSRLRPCLTLRSAHPTVATGEAALRSLLSDLIDDGQAISTSRGGRAWLRRHPTRDVQYLFALSSTASELTVDFPMGTVRRRLRLQMAGGGGGVLRFENGRVTALLLKGIDERNDRSVAPACSIDDFELMAEAPCDLLAVQSGDRWSVSCPAQGDAVARGLYLAQARFRMRESQ